MNGPGGIPCQRLVTMPPEIPIHPDSRAGRPIGRIHRQRIRRHSARGRITALQPERAIRWQGNEGLLQTVRRKHFCDEECSQVVGWRYGFDRA